MVEGKVQIFLGLGQDFFSTHSRKEYFSLIAGVNTNSIIRTLGDFYGITSK